MAEPLTEQALQLIVTMIQQISVANGYFTNIGQGYITTEPTQRPADAATYAAVFETETAINAGASGNRTLASDMSVVVQVFVPKSVPNAKPANLARRASADIVRALKAPLRDLVAGVRRIDLVDKQRITFDDEKFADFVIAQVSARVGLSESIPPANL